MLSAVDWKETVTAAHVEWTTVLKLLVPLFLVGGAIAIFIGIRRTRSSIQGIDSDELPSCGLYRLNAERFRRLEAVYVPRLHGNGTLTRIDYVVLGREGIFVIEAKDARGVVEGTSEARRWRHTLDGRSYEFLNPLVQNAMHVDSLAHFLDLPPGIFHSLVYFASRTKLKGRMPSNVVHGRLDKYISKRRPVLLTDAQVAEIWSRLRNHDRNTDKSEALKKYQAAHSHHASQGGTQDEGSKDWEGPETGSMSSAARLREVWESP